MVSISVDADSVRVVDRMFSRFGDGISDFSEWFEDAAKLLQEQTLEHFDSQGRGTWAPLSPAYAAWKAQHFPGKPIMRATDRLYDSLTKTTGDTIKDISKHKMRWGTKVPYATMHQHGGSRLPQRKLVDLVDENKTALVKSLQRYLVSKTRIVDGIRI